MQEQEVARRGVLVVGLLTAAGVAVALGVYGRLHTPSYDQLPTYGFSTTATFKAWLASAVLVLAASQLVTALWMYGRLPGAGRAPSWLGAAHRATGFSAFVVSLPVAAYCLYGIGFAPEPFTTRTMAHSVAGCAFYGAFSAKVLFVHSRRLPGWALPLVGATLLTAVVVAWLTSALWFFRLGGLHT